MKERLVVAACLVLCLALFVSGASGIVTPKAEPPEQKGPVVLSIKELEPLVEVAPQPVETEARAKRIAKAIAGGEHSDLYGEGYVFQAEFEQGTGVLYCENCGIYFGR